jgi:hypothetical protein
MNYATLNMHVGSLTSDSTVSWICEDGNYQLNKRSQVRSIRPWTSCVIQKGDRSTWGNLSCQGMDSSIRTIANSQAVMH